MNTSASKTIMTLVVVFFLIIVAGKAYSSLKDQVTTEEAVVYTVSENIVFDGVFVRNEQLLSYNSSGIIDYACPDGSKLSVSSVIANVYDSESQIYAQKRIAELEEEILDLERSCNPGTTDYAKPEVIKSQIDQKYVALSAKLEQGDLASVQQIKNEITVLLNIYNIVTKTETDFDSRLAELNEELESYKAQLGSPKDTIRTDHTGYFVSKVDGYETTVSKDNVDEISVETIEQIISGKDAKPTDNYIGKILDSYSCKIVGIIKPTNKFLKGDSLKVRFGTSKNTCSVTVDDIKKIDSEKWILILDCEDIDENISSKRVDKIELIFKEMTGLKVPRNAIRFRDIEEQITDEDGNTTTVKTEYKGVYVRLGQDIEFKKISVIYEGDDFVVSENISDTDFLNLYDQIILEEVKESDVSD